MTDTERFTEIAARAAAMRERLMAGGTYLNNDGTLRLVDWASRMQVPDGEQPNPFLSSLVIPTGSELPSRMAHSTATGQALVTNGHLGVDLIRIAGGQAFVPHTHPGDHLLIVVGGRGTITVGGRIYETHAGQVYMVQGKEPHAVGAITDHLILAVGSPHKAVDDDERMAPVEYQDVLTAIGGQLTCTICHVSTAGKDPLHTEGCTHCPCPWCVTTGDGAEDERLRQAWLAQ